MHDPLEGVTSLGNIATGVSEARVPELYLPVLEAAVSAVRDAGDDQSLYLYGSVATGMARPPQSDVDLLSVELPSAAASHLGQMLSDRFSEVCRAVVIAPARRGDFARGSHAGYGGRVFLKHYCVHLAGPDLHSMLPAFAADARAARGFNGDIGQHAVGWRTELEDGSDPADLGRRLARKTLFAVTGLVSVHDETWTTDRGAAAARWSTVEPALANDLDMLLACGSNCFATVNQIRPLMKNEDIGLTPEWQDVWQ